MKDTPHCHRRVAWLAAALFVCLVGVQVALHLDERGWNAEASPKDMATVDGHLAEWEWFHPIDAVVALAHPRMLPREISSQNIYRFLTPYGIILFYGPTGSLFVASVLTILIGWAAAGWAAYALAGRIAGSPASRLASVLLVATAPGYIAYLSNIDAHPTGYACAAVWLALVEALDLLAPPSAPAVKEFRWLRPALAGILLCIAGYAMELAYPVLLFAWVFYGTLAVARREPLPSAAGRLLVFTAAFAVPYLGFRVVVEQGLGIQVVAFNEPFSYVRASAAEMRRTGVVAWVASRAGDIAVRWPADHPPVISALALLGLLTVTWRWRWWALTWIGAFAGAVSLTRPLVRELFLTYPAVYALAAAGVDRLDATLKRWGAQPRLRWLLLGLVLAAAFVQVNADWWGDYALPWRWFVGQ